MNCCGLSSTGLQDIEANNSTSDNITIYSNLDLGGFSNLKSNYFCCFIFSHYFF